MHSATDRHRSDEPIQKGETPMRSDEKERFDRLSHELVNLDEMGEKGASLKRSTACLMNW